MMKRVIDIDAILAPIPGDNPAGEDLRYSPSYDEIKEARRADDMLDRGDWQREIKTSDWDKVITVSVDALTKKTKDLQIAAWLTEALIKTEDFSGLVMGLTILNGLLRDYWDNVYPEIEDGDLDFRVAPIEFMNDKLWPCIKEVSLTDTGVTPGYSWIKWQESRQVGHEASIRNKYGDVDDKKKKMREELIAEGKLTAEDFDSAVALSSRTHYESLAKDLTSCMEKFETFDGILDEKFKPNPPRLAEFRKALEDCEHLVTKILKEKKVHEPEPGPEPETDSLTPEQEQVQEEKEGEPLLSTEGISPATARPSLPGRFTGSGSMETAMWEQAVEILETSGIKKALGKLLEVSCSASSVREKNRYRLLMAKLCLIADRPDLARPIVEALHSLIEELNLERWESPIWIAEVLDALYQCLTKGEPSNDDVGRAKILFQRLCTTDVTKAIVYKS
jgi:type VI secretion system protein ImpA